MAARCDEIITGCFPTLDSEVHSYVNGILESAAEEFTTADDLFEALGGLLLEIDEEKTEDDIREICESLMRVLKDGETNSTSGLHKILDAPVHLGQLAENLDERQDETKSIWVAKKEVQTISVNTEGGFSSVDCVNNTHVLMTSPNSTQTVDQKKLEKAEAKIKQKQGKRALQDTPAPKTNGTLNEATASQQSNKRESRQEASGTNKSYDIRIEDFDVSFGEKKLLLGADLVMVYGRRYGLVGRNGIGKTTLLRMLASGSLKIPSHISVLHVEQEVIGDDTPAIQSVLESDTVREELLKEEREITAKLQASSPNTADGALSSRLMQIYQKLESIEADKAPARVAMILAGLGFSPKMQKQTTKEFSGGWRMRLALARALFSQPDLLLLDEPTNMLDMKAIIWLEGYLQTWVSTILVVSHDRQFLNAVATDILHLHTSRIDTYRGDYEVFVKTREDRLKNQQKEYEAQKAYRDHIQVFIDRFRFNANRASQVQSKLKLLEKLPELKPIEKESEVILRFPECESLSPPILQLDELTFYYEAERAIFNRVCVSASMDSRICIVGENGAGKTTLLKLLLGELEPISGLRHVHRNLKIGYFSQHHVDQLDMDLTSLGLFAARFPGKTSEVYRQKLGSFGVTADLALRPVLSLSGGQKSRVAFAILSMLNPNFFILDEPTNHLDMETIEALGKALNTFKGGVILVSHDERLIRMICKELWICADNTIRALEGGIDEYKEIVQKELATQV